PEPNYVPDPVGARVLRTVASGRLSELAWFFGADQRPSAGVQQLYRRLDEEMKPTAIGSVFGEMLIFRRVRGAGLPIDAALTLTDAVRAALMSNAGNGGPMPDVISGHGSGAHCAIVALPFVG